MAESFTFEEAVEPKKNTFSFEEAASFTFEEAGQPAQPSTQSALSERIDKALAVAEDIRSGPLIKIPRIEAPAGFPGQSMPTWAKVAAGAYNALAAVPEFLTTPLGAATVAGAGLPAMAQRLVAGGFAVDMARHTPEQIRALSEAVESGDSLKISETATGLGLTGTFIGLTGKHALTKAAPAVETTKAKQEPAPKEPVVEAPETIVAAATKVGDEIRTGRMHPLIEGFETAKPEDMGFLTSKGRFVSRDEANAIAGEERAQSKEFKEGIGRWIYPEDAVKEAGKHAGDYTFARDVAAKGELAETVPVRTEPPAIETTTTLKEGVQPEIAASPEGKVTGIKNAAVDAERQSRGQEPIMAPTRQRNQAVWDKTMERIDSDAGWQDRLITEFQEKPRTPTPEEIVALDHRYVELQSEYTKSVAEGSKHFEEGNALLMEEAKLRSAFYESKLNELEQVSRKIGAEWGRSGQMRQRLMREDYSLAAMESKMRAAKGFEPLTEAEHATIRSLNEKLVAAEKKAVDVEARANQRIALVEAQKALAEAKTQAGQLGYEPRLLARAEKFAVFMDKQSAAASKRLRERLSRVSAGIDPTMLADVAIIGAAKITRGAVDSAKWIDEMARDYGEWIREHKDEAWAASQKAFDELSAKNLGADTGVRRASSELSRLLREKDELQARLRLEDYSPRRSKPVREIDTETASARAEVMLLREQFARELAKENYRRKGTAEKAWLGTKEGINLSRALMTSFDVSAVLRQGGFVTLGHPVRAAQSLGPMMRALRSDKNAAAIDAQIQSRPNAVNGLYERAKLFLAPRDGATLSGMEEAFMSKLARNIPGVAASQRAYVTFLNKLRADSFDQMHESLVSGREPTQVELEAIGNYINVATGRGNIGKAAGAAETLSTVFFAPRLVASRFQLLAGEPMYRGSARTRYMVAKEYGRFLIGLATIYSLGKMAGATIEEDPRSTDFGKLKFGNTRVDPMAGLSQSTVLLSRLGSGETKNLKGQVKPIRGKVPYGSPDSADVIARFLRTKLAPWSGSLVDALTGENVVGEPVTAESIAKNMTVPLSMKDIYEVMTEHGIPHGTAISLLSLLGMSVQNYDQKKKP